MTIDPTHSTGHPRDRIYDHRRRDRGRHVTQLIDVDERSWERTDLWRRRQAQHGLENTA